MKQNQTETVGQLSDLRSRIINQWKQLNELEQSVDVYTSRRIGKAMVDLKSASRHIQDAIAELGSETNGSSEKQYGYSPKEKEFA